MGRYGCGGGQSPDPIEFSDQGDIDGLEEGQESETPDKGTDSTGSYVDEGLEEETNLNKEAFEKLYANYVNNVEENSVPTLFSAVDNLAVQNTGGHEHCVCGKSNCNKEGHNSNQTWTGVSDLSKITEAGYYYLTADVTLTSTWEIKGSVGDVVLCLNSHTIQMKDNKNIVIYVHDGNNLTLTDCSEGEVGKVTHGKNKTGSGVGVAGNGTFTLYGGSISGNNADSNGGGVIVYGTFNMCGGSITKNNVSDNSYVGGGVYVEGGTFNMSGGTIGGTATGEANTAGYGGGVCVSSGGTFTMSGSAITTGNTASNGGGVYVNGGTFTVSGGVTITGNTAKRGGGVYVGSNGNFTMSDGSICNNNATTSTSEISSGGGVYVSGLKSSISKFNMKGGSITGNTAKDNGGGVYLGIYCELQMTNGSISGNSAKCGGGVCVGANTNTTTTFTMNGGSIYNNNASNNNYGSGGGVYVADTFNMNGGSITGNNATGNGAGVFVYGNFTVSGEANIIDNLKGGTTSSEGDNQTENTKNNVYLVDGKTITIGDSDLQEGAMIGVTTEVEPIFGSPVIIATGEKTDVTYGNFFKPDVEGQGYTITSSDGNVYLNAHKHSWTYTADDNTITAKCTGNGCPLTNGNGGSVTINAPTGDLTYNGSVQEATVDTTTGNWNGGSVGDITYEVKNNKNNWVSLTGKPKDAGTYRAKITMTGKDDSVTAISDEYTIAKTNPQVSDFTFTAPTGLTYDGNDKTAEVKANEGISGMGNVTVKYYKDDQVVNKVKDVGTYIVKIGVEGGDNYKATTTELTTNDWTFTIGKATQTITVPNDKTIINNGIAVDISDWASVAGVNNETTGATLTYELAADAPDGVILNDNQLTVANSVAKGTTFTINVTANETTNYNGVNNSFTVKVADKTKENLKVTMEGWTYGDTTKQPVFTKPTDFTGTPVITYAKKKADGTYEDSTTYLTSNSDAGEYMVTVVCETDTAIYTGTANFKIEKKTLNEEDFELKTVDELTKVYDGTDKHPEAVYLTLKDNPNFTLGVDNDKVVYNSANVKDATKATLTLSIPEGMNYKLADNLKTIDVNATINARPITVENVEAQSRVYVKDKTDVDVKVTFKGLPVNTTLIAGNDYTVTGEMSTDTATGDASENNVQVSVKMTNSNYSMEDYSGNTQVRIWKLAAPNVTVDDINQKWNDTVKKEITLQWQGIPADAGRTTFSITEQTLPKGVSLGGYNYTFGTETGKLTYTLTGATAEHVGQNIELKIKISMQNYMETEATLKIKIIDKDPQTNFKFETEELTKTYGDSDFTVTATGKEDGSTVTYSSGDETVATVDENTGKVHIVGKGTTTITATASATDDYNEATANYTLTVNPKQLIIKVNNKTAYVGENPPVLGEDSYTVSGLVGSDKLTTEPTLNYVDASGSTITPDMTKTGDTIIRASGASAGNNYTISHVDGKLTVSNRPSGGHIKRTDVITKDKVTTAPADVKNETKTDEAGNKVTTATATVSDANQKEIIKQVKDNKSEEIIINVSDKDVADGAELEINLDKEFIDSIVNDTDAKLTIKTPAGDRTFTKEELKELSEASTGDTITIDPTDDDSDKAEKIARAKELIAGLNLTSRSSKTTKRNTKVVLKNSAKTKDSIKELKELGFTVKYRFYRSTKKSSGYKSRITKDTASYINTVGKKGTKYYYKVRVMVYDADGNLVAQSDLKQCSYAARTWSK